LEQGADRVVLVNNDATVAPNVIEGFGQAIVHRPTAGLLCGEAVLRRSLAQDLGCSPPLVR
jgi:hypothetical protein